MGKKYHEKGLKTIKHNGKLSQGQGKPCHFIVTAHVNGLSMKTPVMMSMVQKKLCKC
jgi:hypothetical protein